MAGYVYLNENPAEKSIGDCAIRAASVALDQSWEQTYAELCAKGFAMGDLPNADVVWSRYLYEHGFRRHFIPDDGLGAYTVGDFANDNPHGVFVLSMPGKHVVTVVDGNVVDSWDSRNERPSYYFAQI